MRSEIKHNISDENIISQLIEGSKVIVTSEFWKREKVKVGSYLVVIFLLVISYKRSHANFGPFYNFLEAIFVLIKILPK